MEEITVKEALHLISGLRELLVEAIERKDIVEIGTILEESDEDITYEIVAGPWKRLVCDKNGLMIVQVSITRKK